LIDEIFRSKRRDLMEAYVRVCSTKKAAITEDTDPVIEGIHTFETIRNYLIE